ncbi:hypothetical protein Val02_93590 [Virgisporangium aliadipatigenens]|uniref:Uncharacterized protein n=1 Tax=Virgisporangium aliadipatigenens TaxID=741659 RepID=A0A8J3YXJ7_9ACTN|nr:hypothetical protein [Virgisporangium aliadipatigenens]GIJ52473.1 hypothetical protein Val02_93590 [Virgisporangium aliadipatigenens]
MTIQKIFRYRLSYVSNNGRTFGAVDYNRREPISDRSDVIALEAELRKHCGARDLTILSFSLYAEPDGRS